MLNSFQIYLDLFDVTKLDIDMPCSRCPCAGAPTKSFWQSSSLEFLHPACPCLTPVATPGCQAFPTPTPPPPPPPRGGARHHEILTYKQSTGKARRKELQRFVVQGHLFALEDMLVELLLETLIGQVDAQLLKAVLLEALKAVDVQDANAAVGLRPLACNQSALCQNF